MSDLVAWIYLAAWAAMTVWQLVDTPVDREYNSKMYLLTALALEVTLLYVAVSSLV